MIIWTALPNGYSAKDGGFRLTVVVSPRLQSRALGEFTNWPDRIKSLTFDVVFADCPGATSFSNVKPRNALDADLWDRAFRNTLVHDAGETRSEAFNAKVRSFGVSAIANPITEQYKIAVASATPNRSDTVRVQDIGALLDHVQWFRETTAEPVSYHVDRHDLPVSATGLRDVYRLSDLPAYVLDSGVVDLVKVLNGEAALPPDSDRATQVEFLRFALFHRRVPNQPFHQPSNETCLEFHRKLALLLNYPALLRPLGLALDLILVAPPNAFPCTSGRVAVKPNLTFAAGYEPCLPWTKFEHTGVVPFRPAADGDTCSGMLRLQDTTAYHLESLDVDGAAMNIIGFGDSLLRSGGGTAPDERNIETMPALRTAGIAIVSNGRQRKVSDAINRANEFEKACNSGAPILLTARDVTQGYAVDVHSILPGASSGKWLSLCDRDETFTIDGRTIAFTDQTGVVRPGATKAVDKLTTQTEPPNELYVHEALVRWTGWSLTAPRPKSIPRVGVVRSTTNACDWIHFDFKPSRLPRLRFGGRYRFRARLADLAGNTLSPDEAPETCSTGEHVFRRYEPVPAPQVLLVDAPRFDPGRGEQLNRLVVRNGTGKSTRCCVPPRTSHELAEMHGMFDSRSPSQGGSFVAVGREKNGEFFQDPKSGNPLFVPPGPASDVPYYPDPLAYRAQLILLDPLTTAAAIRPFPFYRGSIEAEWPRAERFFVMVVPGARRQQIGTRWIAGDTLEIALPPGREATLRVSSQFSGSNTARLMALVDLASTEPQFNLAMIAAGSHHMITPAEELHLVHAVKQPLDTPTVSTTPRARAGDSTTAPLQFDVLVDDKSTGRIEIIADWSETIDDVAQPGPETRKGHAPVIEKSRGGASELGTTTDRLTANQQFNDTKYRCIDYTAVATTRFAEYFEDKDPRAYTKTSAPAHISIPSSARPSPAVPLYVIPTFGWASRRSGRRFFSDRAGGGLRVYFPRPWYLTGDGELVGIVLAPDGSTEDSPAMTRWGIDPTFTASKIPDLPSPADFEGFVHVRTNVNVPLDTGARFKATVLGYQPVYDPERKLWYADVVVRNPGAYTPFIKLSLVRFQPMSIVDREASMSVPAEFAQLFPSRQVSVTRGSNRHSFCIIVTGDPIPPEDSVERFRISVDRQCIDLGGSVNWLRVPSTESGCTGSMPSTALFARNISLGDVCGPLRVRIEEFEKRMTDEGEKSRLIYADVLEL